MDNGNEHIEGILFSKHIEAKALRNVQHELFGRFELTEMNYIHLETRRLNVFSLLHIEKGSGNFRIDMETYQLKPQSIYFVYPGQLISDIHLNGIDGYLTYAQPEFLLKANPQLLNIKMFQLYGQRHEIHLSDEIHNQLTLISKEMGKELVSESYRRNDILSMLVNLHIYYTDRFLYKKYFSMGLELHPKLSTFFALINIEGKLNLKVSDYASKLNISPNYLNDLVKRQTGRSAKTLIKEKTIQQACAYLIHTDFEIKEIAYQLGYNYPQYFDRDFKNALAMTPRQYRKANR